MTTPDDRFAQLVSDALARILEASSSTYLPDAVGPAYAAAIRAAAEEPELADVSVVAVPGRTVADLSEAPTDALAELCGERAEQDPQNDLPWLLDAEEVGSIGSPIGGGMNSGTSSTLFAFVCNGNRYTYESDFEGMGNQFVCGDGHPADTDEGRASFVDEVIGFFEYLWGHSECWVQDDIIPPERMDELRGSPWEHDVIEDHFQRYDLSDRELESLAQELAGALDLEIILARTFLAEIRANGRVETDHPFADRAGWWMIETQLH